MAFISVRGLRVSYRTRRGTVQAVDGVSFDLDEGEKLGLVGESGCGKSTVAKTFLAIHPPNAEVEGKILFKGRDFLAMTESEIREIRWKEIALIPQSAMNALNPVYRVGDQIEEIFIKRAGAQKTEARERAEDLFRLVGLNKARLRDFPHQFSGGMTQRVSIAMAMALNPSLIIADEPTTALDVITQDQVLRNIYRILKQHNKSMIMITHDISVVAEGCDTIAVMYAGQLMEYGGINTVLQSPLNPYTLGLRNAFPSLRGPKSELVSIPGYPPSLISPPKGCRFFDRCPFADSQCAEERPELLPVLDNHFVACHQRERVEELRGLGNRKETWTGSEKPHAG